MKRVDRIAHSLVEHRRIALVVLLVTVLTVGAGVVHLEQESGMPAFTVGSDEEAALEAVESTFTTEHDDVTVAQVVVEDDNVLTKETLLGTLELQQEIREHDDIEDTLVEDDPTTGVANVIATVALRESGSETTSPTLDEQIAVLESLSQAEIDAIVRETLDGESADALELMPNSYESGSTTASATMLVVFQTDELGAATGQAPERIIDSQTTVERLAVENAPGETVTVVGNGILSEEMAQADEETMLIVGPLALLLVVLALALAYRDLFDIVVSLLGLVVVQLWTFGALGWAGIAFNPVLIAVPVLLVGLSIDFGIHVFMRYREARASGEGIAAGMATGLAGVGVALLWVTVTTAIGFLSNLASPVPIIREVGIIAAVGIVGALVVFGLLVPTLKVELDTQFERLGLNRAQRPLGAGSERISALLSLGERAARLAPVLVIAAVLVVTLVAGVVATDVGTSFDSEDTLVDDAPDWAQSLPGPLGASEYSAADDLETVDEQFVHPDSQVEILVEGSVADPSTLERFAAAERQAADHGVVDTLPDGEAQTTSPLTVMDRVAAAHPSFAEVYYEADTTGDGVPDENVSGVYDALYAVAPTEADRVLDRSGGEYDAARLAVAVDRGAGSAETTESARELAATVDGEGVTATATGQQLVNEVVEESLLESLLTSLAVTVLVVMLLLATAFRRIHGSATLGVVTMLPVVASVAWLVATMRVLGYPLNLLTAMVASLAIGIGIDYSIHMSERFRAELEDAPAGEAIRTAVHGTGAALLGSATTTALGFGVLALALLPILQQFGVVTTLMIVYAFVGAVFVLPSLLVVWARRLTPTAEPAQDPERTPKVAETAGD